MKYILGISAFYHDSAATILKDGCILAAFQEERFSRIKQDASFPVNAIKQCLKKAGISIDDVSLICYYEDSKKKHERIVKTYLSKFPKGVLSFLKNAPSFRRKRNILQQLKGHFYHHFKFNCLPEIKCFEHHLSHAASAFYPSPYAEAGILCIDGVGEWATISAWHGKNSVITQLWEISFPHSLGLLYSAFTQYCGFKVDSGEYKLMGLAPYGDPRFKKLIYDYLIKVNNDEDFQLNTKYFDYEVGNSMINKRFERLFGAPARAPESEITQHYMDMAASIQMVTEEIVLMLAKKLKKSVDIGNLCMAGGVALNCVSNGKLIRKNIFKNIWIQPASGDAGGALGAALLGYYTNRNKENNSVQKNNISDQMNGAYLGNEYLEADIKQALDLFSAKYIEYNNDDELLNTVAKLIEDDHVVGWFQGRMEFGPRALGNRSILGNPQSKEMQSIMNLKIKNRESFRPFAPAVLQEYAADWFDSSVTSPYMLVVSEIKNNKRIHCDKSQQFTGLSKLKNIRSQIPAITHVDYSARVQTVNGAHNPKFYNLLNAYYKLTNCPILINTSFNVRGEPIVESPTDAYKCFMRTSMDYLVIGNFLLEKSKQPKWKEIENWREKYVLD